MSESASHLARELAEATRSLAAALRSEDDAGVAAALERRDGALAGLKALDAAAVAPLRPVLEDAERQAAEALALAHERLGGIQVELERIRRARAAARALRGEDRPARFVSERV